MKKLERTYIHDREQIDEEQSIRERKSRRRTQHPEKLGEDPAPDSHTPFHPRAAEHTSLLAQAQSDEQRANLVTQLQQTYGNRYVQRLLGSTEIQAKLTVNVPNDVYEQEADEVATVVTRMVCSGVERQDVPEGPGANRTDCDQGDMSDTPPVVSPELEARIKAASSGETIAEDVRRPLQQAFDADFSGVRVHTDTEADYLNQVLQSRAFTTGQDIFFRKGEYDPGNPSGQELLAHELTHTLQQGASRRVAPWWPLGHQTITAKVFGDTGALRVYFQEDAIKYLEARSPDFDFLQDETNAMEKGIADSKPKIKSLKAIVDKGEEATEEEKGQAKNLWDKNELHQRPQWYMLHHGEGGFYKEDASSGAAKNSGVTERLVALAAELYNAGKREAGLSILSDALHQAEDRGSHQEGEKFKGHDIRQTVHPSYIPEDAEEQPPEGYYTGSKPDPDNADKNPQGAVNALYFASEVLTDFIYKIEGILPEITLKTDKEQPRTSERRSKMGGLATVTSGDWRTKLAGHTGAKSIKGIEPEQYERLGKQKERELSEEERKLVDTAERKYIIEWLTSELMEQIRKEVDLMPKKERNVGHDMLLAIGYDKFLALAFKSYPELMERLTPDEVEQIVERAVQNYEYQWKKERYSEAKPASVWEG